jgi:two-component system chemotaxis response regulator CheY
MERKERHSGVTLPAMRYINRNVLIADDQSPPRHQLRELLRHTDCSVVGEARNTDDALLKFETLQPDVVIIDVTLLGTLDALIAIKRMHQTNPAVTIFATASSSQQGLLMEAMTMGAVDFLLKPFKAHSVHAALERNL